MNKMENFSFVWYTHTDSFSLNTYKGTYTPYKEPLKVDFRLKDGL